MMLVMVLVLSELLVSDVTADVALNRALENRKTRIETDQGQSLDKPGVLGKGPCANGWLHFPYLLTCFQFVPQAKTWIEAELYCQGLSRGGHLASIHWNRQNEFIGQVILTKNNASPPSWIGLSQSHKEWVFLWNDGSSLDFTNWDVNQPDDYQGKQKCVQIDRDVWNDQPCDNQKPFICSYTLH
ncbi:C-type lectin BjL-like [Heterodontus francisci]|uniref:C-type lectin BjL-like n=1 Tax=Heterodontus francisci TaxID=7792 RepID=UPI00355BE0B9